VDLRKGKLCGRVVAERIALDCGPGALLEGLAAQADPVMLDSSALDERYGRYTLLACRPLEVLTGRDGVLRDRSHTVLADDNRSLWSVLGGALECVKLSGGAPEAGYAPGWIGYVGYEIGRHIERLPGRAVRDTNLPDLRLAFYDAVLVYDAIRRQWHLAQLQLDRPPPGAGQAAAALRTLAERAPSRARGTYVPEPAPAPTQLADASAHAMAPAQPNFTTEQYRQAVARCMDYIAAGDIFQVNLSQRLAVAEPGKPLDLYRALRRRNPAWYAAFLSFRAGGQPCAILSSSPELFLRVRGRRVLTRPIKGTRPRVGDEAIDRAAADDLLASPKDNAELAMIVDLLRNDLGRVCRYGTVRVAEPRTLETHPTVFHLVGTVEGRLCDDVGPADLLKATFPGGSITGAPKIRAMEIIDELEPSARGVYTGCIGHVGVDGSCEWNIAIRTIICDGDMGYVQVGGGIVADSSPTGEYNETLDKARAMLEAIAQVAPARPAGAPRALTTHAAGEKT